MRLLFFTLTALLSGLLSQSAFAFESSDLVSTCTNGKVTRKVVVVYAQTGKKFPCQVIYVKDTERPGKVEILYEANTSSGFCERKAGEFLGKVLSSWKCEGNIEVRKPASGETPPKSP